MRILIIDPQFEGLPDIERAVTGADAEIVVWQTPIEGPVPEAEFRLCDALVNCRSRHVLTAEIVAMLDRCRIVGQAGVGFNHIDLEACGRRGIPVCNVPDYGTTEVADHAVTMAMTLLRGIPSYDRKLRARLMGWHAREQQTVRRIRGLRFGIVGLGRIGTATALRARAFETVIDFFDPYLPAGAERAFGFERAASLEDLLARVDVVSLHTPLTPETRGMINRDSLAAARPGLVLVNTSRGPVCDLDGIEWALRESILAAVGLDVLPVEPLDYAHPLLGAWERDEPWLDGRILITPHAAFFSPDSIRDMRRLVTETVVNYLRHGTLRSCVNAHLIQPQNPNQ